MIIREEKPPIQAVLLSQPLLINKPEAQSPTTSSLSLHNISFQLFFFKKQHLSVDSVYKKGNFFQYANRAFI